MARRAHPVLAALVLVVAGCSFVIDTSELDRQCPAGQKECGVGHCVSIHDPAYGCTQTGCEPCELNNAIPKCDERTDTCEVDACLFGFDCPNTTGCPVNILVDPSHCGSCEMSCESTQTCRNGACEDPTPDAGN